MDMAAGMSKEVKGVASDTFVVVSAADGLDFLVLVLGACRLRHV